MSNIRVIKHDRLQLEIKTKYLSKPQSRQEFQLDMWLYLPISAGISPSNYHSDDFYEDLRSYTRLKTPIFSLQDLLQHDNSPISVLQVLIAKPKSTKGNQKQIRREMKLLSCIFRQAMKAELQIIENEEALQEKINILNTLVHNWRQILSGIKAGSYKKKTKVCAKYVDEAISNQMEVLGLHILEIFEDKELLCREDIVIMIRAEERYREENDYQYNLTSSKNAVQYLVHLGNLKKFTSTVLFLNNTPDRISGLIRHIALGVAAGLAMAWAIAAQLYALVEFGLNPTQGMSQSLIALFTVVGIFSYILKDRIKATSGAWISKKISKWLYDRRYYYSMTDDDSYIALIAEQMTFETSSGGPKLLQEKWREMERRKLSIIVGGDVLHYQRSTKMLSEVAHQSFDRFQGLVDINRIHVWRWVKTFADPQKELSLLDEHDLIKKKKVKRVYEVDMAVRLIEGKNEEWALVKIQLDRRGIVDVQQLA